MCGDQVPSCPISRHNHPRNPGRPTREQRLHNNETRTCWRVHTPTHTCSVEHWQITQQSKVELHIHQVILNVWPLRTTQALFHYTISSSSAETKTQRAFILLTSIVSVVRPPYITMDFSGWADIDICGLSDLWNPRSVKRKNNELDTKWEHKILTKRN